MDVFAIWRWPQSRWENKILRTDTTPDAERMQLHLLRGRSPADRLGLALRLSSEVIRASKRAISRAHPELTEREVGHFFIELHYGRELAEATRRYEETSDEETSDNDQPK